MPDPIATRIALIRQKVDELNGEVASGTALSMGLRGVSCSLESIQWMLEDEANHREAPQFYGPPSMYGPPTLVR